MGYFLHPYISTNVTHNMKRRTGLLYNKLLAYDEMDINGYQTTNFIFNVKGP